MKQFKNYLQTQLSILEVKLQSIIKDIESFPSPELINPEDYGTKEELKKIYNEELRPNIIKRIIGPSKSDLQIHIKNREKVRLYKIKSGMERQISQIKETLPLLDELGIHGTIYPNEEIIRYILEYASTRNINPKEVLSFIVDICKYTQENDKVEEKIKRNISRFFDDTNTILEDTKLSTLTLLFDKLFNIILSKQENDKYTLVINQLMTQLKVDKDKVLKKETKPELELKRRALIELQDYINGTQIIKTLDIDNFSLLLKTADVPTKEREALITKMEIKIQEEQEEKERNLTIEALKRFLTEEEYELVRKADIKERKITGPLKDLLSRAKKDVISMCKYLSYFEEVTDTHESQEILDDRVRVLKHVLINIDEEEKEPNELFYITDKDGVPVFLRNLELHELSSYNRIYNLLYKVATKVKGKKLFTQDNLDFYYIGNRDIKIVYTELHGIRIILGIDSLHPSNSIKNTITLDIIEQIREIECRSINPEFKEIHSTYENIILEALNLKETGFTLSLKK